MKSSLDPNLYSPIKSAKSSARSPFGLQSMDGYEMFRQSINAMETANGVRKQSFHQSSSLKKEDPEPPILKDLDYYTTGYFRVDPLLGITKHEHPFKNMDELFDIDHVFDSVPEGQGPCKVSIPLNTISVIDKKYIPKTRSTFKSTDDSVNLADVSRFDLPSHLLAFTFGICTLFMVRTGNQETFPISQSRNGMFD